MESLLFKLVGDMSVLDMKAHVLGFLEETEGYRDEETGDWISGKTKETESYCKCDLVPNGRANTITIPDGSAQTYSYTVRNLPRDCREFRYGDKITLCLYGKPETKKTYTVLGFHRYQLQCKIWV